MQGFNKYYPPDYDGEKHKSLNSYRGKHALGSRAHKIDQGILVVRFELPFNIWCGTCNNHIGMGVRYNAEKKKIGNYYSTPIFSFRCKCHLCDGYFEIETDPKNTRYVVTSGARQKDEDWDPEENGGFAVHETDPRKIETDPLAALEKSTAAQNDLNTVKIPRLEALQSVSDKYNEDPYTLSSKVRKRFREVKKVEAEKTRKIALTKEKYGLADGLTLLDHDEGMVKDAKSEWERERARFKLKERLKQRQQRMQSGVVAGPSSSKQTTTSSAASLLKSRLLSTSAQRSRS